MVISGKPRVTYLCDNLVNFLVTELFTHLQKVGLNFDHIRLQQKFAAIFINTYMSHEISKFVCCDISVAIAVEHSECFPDHFTVVFPKMHEF